VDREVPIREYIFLINRVVATPAFARWRFGCLFRSWDFLPWPPMVFLEWCFLFYYFLQE